MSPSVPNNPPIINAYATGMGIVPDFAWHEMANTVNALYERNKRLNADVERLTADNDRLTKKATALRDEVGQTRKDYHSVADMRDECYSELVKVREDNDRLVTKLRNITDIVNADN